MRRVSRGVKAVAPVAIVALAFATAAAQASGGSELTFPHKTDVHSFAVNFQRENDGLLRGLVAFTTASRAGQACSQPEAVPGLAKAFEVGARGEYTFVHTSEVEEKPLYAYSQDLAHGYKPLYVEDLDGVGGHLDTELAETRDAENIARGIAGDCAGSLDKLPPIATKLKHDAEGTSRWVVELARQWGDLADAGDQRR